MSVDFVVILPSHSLVRSGRPHFFTSLLVFVPAPPIHSLPLSSILSPRMFVLSGDPSRWAEFCREEKESLTNGDLKQVTITKLTMYITKLKADILATTVVEDEEGGKQLYHLHEKGINVDVRRLRSYGCNFCGIYYTDIKTLKRIKSKVIQMYTKKQIHLGDDTIGFHSETVDGTITTSSNSKMSQNVHMTITHLN